jgi:hypothetical protein
MREYHGAELVAKVRAHVTADLWPVETARRQIQPAFDTPYGSPGSLFKLDCFKELEDTLPRVWLEHLQAAQAPG